MKNKNLVLLFLLLMVEGGLLSAAAQSKSSVYKPWSHGQLKVSKENRKGGETMRVKVQSV